MALRAVINMNPAPTIFTVTGGGPYCSADPGMPLGLGGSDTGVTYTLYQSGSSSEHLMVLAAHLISVSILQAAIL